MLLNTPHLSLLSPPGLATCFDPHTGNSSVLDLYIGDLAFNLSTFFTGPYMESDHLPVIASFPQGTLKPHPGCLPRWKISLSKWPQYRAALLHTPTPTTLPLEEAAQTLSNILEEVDRDAFPLTSATTPIAPASHGGMMPVPRLYESSGEHGISGTELLHCKLAQNIATWMPYPLGPFSRSKEEHGTHTAPPSLSPPPLKGLGISCTPWRTKKYVTPSLSTMAPKHH